MFQDFTERATPDHGPARLERLRDELRAEGLDGFLVPRADLHQGEYVAPADQRLAWLTGFTGSAGFAVALRDTAAVFIDGRYRLQVRAQVDTRAFAPVDWPETQLGDWLPEQLPDGGKIGLDPWLHTETEVEKLRTRLDGTGVALVETENLVDRVWEDRPAPPAGPIVAHPLEFAGQSAAEKREATARQPSARRARRRRC